MAQGRAKATPIDYRISQHIKNLRIKAGMTQTQLANKLGVTYQQVCKFEGGINKWSISRITEVAKLFGVPVSSIVETEPVQEDFARSRAVINLMRSFHAMSPEHQQVFLDIGRALAE